jgi:hypothetical protein
MGVVVVASGATEASAQVVGTFRWQLAPFCNVVTLRVERKGATLYELSGTDDLCGAAQAASANGSAHVNPNGTASVSLTVIRPDGIPVTSSAAINLVGLSGTWSDEYGNSGAFTFNPAAAPGSPRPLTIRGTYGIVFNADAANEGDTSAFSFGRPLTTAPLAPAANIIQFGAASTLNCPGSYDNPLAAPGHLCIYERIRANVTLVTVLSAVGSFGFSDVTGATMFVRSTAAGQAFVLGAWAVTIP